MTTIKIYDNQNADNYIEVMNCIENHDTGEREEIEINISFEELKDIWGFYLSQKDAEKLIQYLKEQFLI